MARSEAKWIKPVSWVVVLAGLVWLMGRIGSCDSEGAGTPQAPPQMSESPAEMDLYQAAGAGPEATSVIRVTGLLNQGADVNATFGFGGTALHAAAAEGRAEVIRLLISRGAKVDARDSCGDTPLLRAVMTDRDHRDAIKALLENGADPGEEYEDHETLLSVLRDMVQNGIPYAAEHLALLEREWKKRAQPEVPIP